jgi:putative SOS response-associated peptidase YedK
MCGRIDLNDHPGVQLLLDYLGVTLSPERFESRYNVAPTAKIFAVVDNKGPQIAEMAWGILPHWAKPGKFSRPLINARSETIWEKPAFRHLIKSNRAIILANGFYEWNRDGKIKTPFYIKPKYAPAFAFAGLYQVSKEGVPQCCIITTLANDVMAPIHDRQPAILPPEKMRDWMTSDDKDLLDSLMAPVANDFLEAIQVSSYVNNARNQGPKCIEPVTSEP